MSGKQILVRPNTLVLKSRIRSQEGNHEKGTPVPAARKNGARTTCDQERERFVTQTKKGGGSQPSRMPKTMQELSSLD